MVDAEVQRVLDRVAESHRRAPSSPVRTTLARELAAIGVMVHPGNVDAWAEAIADGQSLKAEVVYT